MPAVPTHATHVFTVCFAWKVNWQEQFFVWSCSWRWRSERVWCHTKDESAAWIWIAHLSEDGKGRLFKYRMVAKLTHTLSLSFAALDLCSTTCWFQIYSRARQLAAYMYQWLQSLAQKERLCEKRIARWNVPFVSVASVIRNISFGTIPCVFTLGQELFANGFSACGANGISGGWIELI